MGVLPKFQRFDRAPTAFAAAAGLLIFAHLCPPLPAQKLAWVPQQELARRPGPVRVLRANAYPRLAQAVAAAGNDTEILLPNGYAGVLDSQLLLSGDNLTLRCEPTARIQKRFDGDAIHITGRNIRLEGCRIDGDNRRYKGGLIILNDARGVVIDNSVLANGSDIAAAVYTSTNVTISGCSITGNLGSPIFAQDGLDRIEIASNSIDSTAAASRRGIDTIGIHTWMRGGRAENIDIHDNTIVHGGDNFAVEVGAFGEGSIPPSNVAMARNIIRLAGDSNGAISYSTLNHGAISENRIDAGGHQMRIDAIELVSTTQVIVSHNSLIHAEPTAAYTIAINGGRENVVEDNVFEGGIYVGTSRADWPNVDHNLIRGNTLTAAPRAELPRGLIWFQCNTFHCSISGNVATGNTLNGNGTGAGVNLENDYWSSGGRVDGNQVRDNRTKALTAPVNIGPHVTNTQAEK